MFEYEHNQETIPYQYFRIAINPVLFEQRFIQNIISIYIMLKAFELTLKIGTIPVFSLPHISPNTLSKVQHCKKFNDYIEKMNHLEKGVEI